MPVSSFVARYDHVLLDLDGCLWVADEALPGAPEALQALRDDGKGVAFLTNDPMHHPEEYVRKLWRLGFRASLEEVVTVGAAVQFLLATGNRTGTAYVIGSAALRRHVAEAGLRVTNGTDLASRSELVVVSGHVDFDFAELRTATQAVLRGAELVGVARDPTFPMPDGPWPGSGSVLAAVEPRQAVPPTPSRASPSGACTRPRWTGSGREGRSRWATGWTPTCSARAAGLDQALVLTGATSAGEAAATREPPTRVAESLASLVLD
jgi:ribonucleotide monophosphatase NagD (HAD superfamily)